MAFTTPEESRIPTLDGELYQQWLPTGKAKGRNSPPTKIDVCSEIASQLDRAYLGGIGRGEGLEHSLQRISAKIVFSGKFRRETSTHPRDTAEHLGNDEHGEGLGKDEDEDEAGESDEGGHHDDFGSESVGSPTVDLDEMSGWTCGV